MGTQDDATKGESRPRVVCVFCAASPGNSETHLEAARALAHELHKNNIHLVYGGGTTGMMGELAKIFVSLSGPQAILGVIPTALIKYEQARPNLNHDVFGPYVEVPDMHKRKHLMAEKVKAGGPGSGFVALSGGFGTMEELMEVTTWNQLGIHDKPVVVYNVEGYYDGLFQWIRSAVGVAFISDKNKTILVEAKTARECVEQLGKYELSEGRLKLDWTEK